MAISLDEFVSNYKKLERESAMGKAHAAAIKSIAAQIEALPSKPVLDVMMRNAELAQRIMPRRR